MMMYGSSSATYSPWESQPMAFLCVGSMIHAIVAAKVPPNMPRTLLLSFENLDTINVLTGMLFSSAWRIGRHTGSEVWR